MVTDRSPSSSAASVGVDEPERVLAGRYLLGPTLGRGGMATVYRGTDRLLRRVVAIKVLDAPAEADHDFVARFRREARSAASLNHPNVVQIFDTGKDGDAHFIVMECVEGTTLSDVLREDGALPPRRATEIAMAICSALEAAHERGLVHRDIKPGNVMVTETGGVKVMDFGIARTAWTDSYTRPGVVFGTAWYLSPEQARGLPADARSDLYAVGCVLYETLTGRPPFLGDSPVSVAYQHVSEKPARVTKLDPSIPTGLETVVRRALAKDPDRRYQSAAEMKAALGAVAFPDGAVSPAREAAGAGAAPTAPIPRRPPTEVLAVEPVPGRARTRPPPASKRRPPAWAFLLLAAAILAAAVIAIALALKGSPLAAPTQPPPASRTHSPTPTSVEAAYAALTQAIDSGVQSGQISHKAGNDLLHQAGDILGKYQEGEREEIGKKIDEMQARIDEYAAKGDISSSNEAAALHQAVTAFGDAMQAGESPSQGD